MAKLTISSYRLLSAFRHEIRKFISFSEQAARRADIEPQQHQLLLAIRGLPEGSRPTIGELAARLCLQHHSTVALVDKLESRQLLRRERNPSDRREVLLKLTPAGESLLRSLSAQHWEQLAATGPAMVAALNDVVAAAQAERKAQRLTILGRNVPKSSPTKRPSKATAAAPSARARQR